MTAVFVHDARELEPDVAACEVRFGVLFGHKVDVAGEIQLCLLEGATVRRHLAGVERNQSCVGRVLDGTVNVLHGFGDSASAGEHPGMNEPDSRSVWMFGEVVLEHGLRLGSIGLPTDRLPR